MTGIVLITLTAYIAGYAASEIEPPPFNAIVVINIKITNELDGQGLV